MSSTALSSGQQSACACGACQGTACLCPGQQDIPAGLAALPPQAWGFPEFRESMLSQVPAFGALEKWSARQPGDLGLMLLEWWAYIADVLRFYDGVRAQEGFLRTAQSVVSAQRLAALLGYRPSPAVSASVWLAAITQSRTPLVLKAGLGFRSGAFEGEAPQVFELESDTLIDPARNQWELGTPESASLSSRSLNGALPGVAGVQLSQALLQAQTLMAPVSWIHAGSLTSASSASSVSAETASGGEVVALESVYLNPGKAALNGLKAGAALFFLAESPAFAAARRLTALREYKTVDDRAWKQLDLDAALDLPASLAPESVTLHRFHQKTGLWTMPGATGVVGAQSLLLSGVVGQIQAGDRILLGMGDGPYRYFQVASAAQENQLLDTGGASEAVDVDGDSVDLDVGATEVPVTRIVLDEAVNAASRKAPGDTDTWDDGDAALLTVHYAARESGRLEMEMLSGVAGNEPLGLKSFSRRRPFRYLPPLSGRFLLRDSEDRGADVEGTLDFVQREFRFADGEKLDPPLTPPLTAYGNLLYATRGETVPSEILGSGNGSLSGQVFVLKKNPLSYSSTPGGYLSTLRVWVGGVLWREAPYFYGQSGDAEIYVLRQNAEGETEVVFGDGTQGKRLPSGIDNVVASYRFGAGGKAPPPLSINQVVNPPSGLSEVVQPLSAFGGGDSSSDDAEGLEELKTHAPQTALLLGRAISLADFEALAATQSGVSAVKVDWHWLSGRQRPGVTVWLIADEGVEEQVASSLRAQSDPGYHFDVVLAEAHPMSLSLQVDVDSRYVEKDVLAELRLALLTGDGALFAPEGIGIGAPLFRSRILAAALAVPGVLGVPDLQHDGLPFTEMGLKPGRGRYFDVAAGGLWLNGALEEQA